ncbi:MAG: hypothetical protein AB3N64_09050 [Puniceicoccaceae bacterium]
MKKWGLTCMVVTVAFAAALGGEFNKAAGIVVAKGMSDDGAVVVLRTPPGAQEWGYWWKPPGAPLILGDLPGGAERTRPLAISGDGSTVVGWSSSANGDSEAFRWTSKGIEELGDLSTSRFESKATGITYDGKVVLGEGIVARNGFATPQAAIWSDEGWITGLGFLPGGYDRTYVIDCSADGTLVVGTGFSENGSQTWRWDSVNLMVDIGPIPVDGSESGRQNAALACSDDGTQIIGLGYDLELGWSHGPTHIWYWDETNGFNVLAEAPGGPFLSGKPAVFGSNSLVSDDMSAIIAPYSGGSTSGILRWDAIVGISELETQGKMTTVTDISADGEVVVGMMTDFDNTSHAVIWGPDGQLKILKDFLEEARTDTLDFALITAAAVSADGRAVAGQIGVDDPYQPSAYHATLDGLWIFDKKVDEFWNYSDWYGYYSEASDLFMWHSEHGWQFSTGDELSAYIFDYGLDCWYWTNADLYPYFYKFGYLEGWVYYYVGCEPTERWFYLFDTGTNVQEEEMKLPPG